jgi:glycosyltransferase involved in cell wall biosynthesis
MELTAEVNVSCAATDVWSFFMDLSNLPRWDQGVASVEVSADTGGIGTTFDTVGHNGRRMSYEVTELQENYRHKCLTRSGEFNWAEWEFTLSPSDSATTVACVSRFSLRRRFLWLAPALRLLGKRGVRRDLGVLKQVLEQDVAYGEPSTRSGPRPPDSD